MEKKYDEFLNYNWNESQEWRQYFNNLSDIPRTTELVMRFRKRFYKLKIDPEFDDKYIPIRERENQKLYNICDHRSDKKSIFDNLMSALESFIWVAYFFNVLIRNYIIPICLIPLYLRLLKSNGSYLPRLTREYFDSLLYSEYFHLIIFTQLLMIENVNYLFLFPLTLTAIYSICDYFANYLRIMTFLKKYFEKITSQKEKIESLRGFTYVLIACYSMIAVLIGWVGYLFTILYLIFLRFLYTHNYNVAISFLKIRRSLELLINNNKTPRFIKLAFRQLINVFIRIGGGDPNLIDENKLD